MSANAGSLMASMNLSNYHPKMVAKVENAMASGKMDAVHMV